MCSGSVNRHDARSMGDATSSGRSCTVKTASGLSRSAGGYGSGGARFGSRARPARRTDLRRGLRLDPHANGSCDRCTVVAERFRGREPDHARAAHDVPLPSRPRDAVPTPEQEAVAGFDAIGQPGHRECANAQRQARRRSPVRDAVEQPAISGARIGRTEHDEVRLERHQPVRVAGCTIEVDNPLARAGGGVDRIPEHRPHHFIRTRVAERHTLFVGRDRDRLDPTDSHAVEPTWVSGAARQALARA